MNEVWLRFRSSAKKLHQASDTIEKAKARSNAIGRRLKDVQELPAGDATVLLPHHLVDVDEDLEVGENHEAEPVDVA